MIKPFRRFLRPEDPGRDVERLLGALLPFPGAPRFQQPARFGDATLSEEALAAAVQPPAQNGK